MRHILTIGDVNYGVTLARADGSYRLSVDGGPATRIGLAPTADGDHRLTCDGRGEAVVLAVVGDRVYVHIAGQTHEMAYVDPVRFHTDRSGTSTEDVALAPMPGTVVAVYVGAGDTVEAGQPLVVIESMKLETTIKAWRAGTVAAVHVGKGEQFERKAALVALAPEAGGV